MSTQSTENRDKVRSSGTFSQLNERFARYFDSYQGRGIFLAILLTTCPLITVGQAVVLFEFSAGSVGGLVTFLTLICSSLAIALLALRLSFYIERGPLYLGQLHAPRKANLTEEEQDSATYQEFRAQGRRILVDGVAFQYGNSRRFFERAPWYRN